MSLKGFEKGFPNSKIVSRKILSDSNSNLGIDRPGNYTNTVSLKSNTPGAVDATAGGSGPMVPSSAGGASGDGPTPGFNGNGSGVAELNGAHGNISPRSAY